jgi:CSLREA domain-containing protein
MNASLKNHVTPGVSLKRKLVQRLLAVSILLLLLTASVFSLAPLTQAKPNAVITVNTLTDVVANDGVCSLREAIQSANAGMPIGNCTSGISGPDTIIITATGTIVLGSALPVPTQDVDIVGPGAESLTISGNNTTRIISITAGVRATLSNVTLANGNAGAEDGGAIFNRGTLTISSASLLSNTAHYGGALSNSGQLYITGTALYSNTSTSVGGAIYNLSFITITASAVYSNSAPQANGGGIYNSAGHLNVMDSAFYGNSATVSGGGIDNQGGTLNVVNSTFYNNKVPIGAGGGILNNGTLTVTNSTIAGNSHNGLFNGNGSTTLLRNTMIVNTTNAENCSGVFIDGGNNLQYGGTVANSCGAGIPTGNPRLAPLGDYGGSTPTLALMGGSAAIDAGSDALCPATDQRGVKRPLGLHCDIGAYEFMPTIYLPLVLK